MQRNLSITTPCGIEIDLEIEQRPDLSSKGGEVWDAAIVLAKFCERLATSQPPDDSKSPTHLSFANKSIIELGAGTGALGLAVSLLGFASFTIFLQKFKGPKSVVLTDQNSSDGQFDLLQQNVSQNKQIIDVALKKLKMPQVNLSVIDFDWTSDTIPESITQPFDIILVSDCIYEPTLFDPLLNALKAIATENSTLLMSYEKRHKRELAFWESFAKHFEFSKVSQSQLHPNFRCEEIGVFICKKKVSAN